MVGVPPRPALSRSLLQRARLGRSPRRFTDLQFRAMAWLRWVGAGRIVMTVLAAVITVVGGFWLLRTPDPHSIREDALAEARSATYEPVTPTEYTLALGPNSAGGAPASAGTRSDPDMSDPGISDPKESAEIVVHIVGAVVAPGVYALDVEARVIDAVRAAGGPTDQAQLDAMNLAATISDGQRLVVPTVAEVRRGSFQPPAEVSPAPGASRGVTGNAPPGDQRININTAGEEELSRLPGVGPATAAAIVADRIERGPFATVDELIRVRGIGPAKLNALRAQARV
jgi:competence protein ComEA